MTVVRCVVGFLIGAVIALVYVESGYSALGDGILTPFILEFMEMKK